MSRQMFRHFSHQPTITLSRCENVIFQKVDIVFHFYHFNYTDFSKSFLWDKFWPLTPTPAKRIPKSDHCHSCVGFRTNFFKSFLWDKFRPLTPTSAKTTPKSDHCHSCVGFRTNFSKSFLWDKSRPLTPTSAKTIPKSDHCHSCVGFRTRAFPTFRNAFENSEKKMAVEWREFLELGRKKGC
ncbi:hypothetical protein CDAR_414721 [Caerostris darwini]|uniref:Uncharacterized protein n=1 Tax=Caerostris darwini TaxID=1538125 RepID=A0AAV4RGQ0_9ARAC|nr:hypothetical protein CDAR_414721 [Caerostris darwini]